MFYLVYDGYITSIAVRVCAIGMHKFMTRIPVMIDLKGLNVFTISDNNIFIIFSSYIAY